MDPNQSLEVNQGNEILNQQDNDPSKYTLDERKRESLKRELNSIFQKSKIALFPMASTNTKLLDWDFWGPLFFCLIFLGPSFLLSYFRFNIILAKFIRK